MVTTIHISTHDVTLERVFGDGYSADQRWYYAVWAGDDVVIGGYARTKREAKASAAQDIDSL